MEQLIHFIVSRYFLVFAWVSVLFVIGIVPTYLVIYRYVVLIDGLWLRWNSIKFIPIIEFYITSSRDLIYLIRKMLELLRNSECLLRLKSHVRPWIMALFIGFRNFVLVWPVPNPLVRLNHRILNTQVSNWTYLKQTNPVEKTGTNT